MYAQQLIEKETWRDQFLVRNYTQQDGLPHKNIMVAHQDSDGYLWFGTLNGLVRFDGLSFKTFSSRSHPKFQNNAVYDIEETSDNTLWIAIVVGGLLKYKNGTFTRITEAHGLSSTLIKSIDIDSDGDIWIGTYGNGVKLMRQDSVVATFDEDNGLLHNNVWRLFVDSRDRVWAGTNGGLNLIRNEQIVKQFTTENGLSYDIIRGIEETRNGDIWIGTDKEGITVIRDTTVVDYIDRSDGLNNLYTQFIMQDRENNLVWTASHGGGINLVTPTGIRHFTEKHGLASNQVTEIFQDRSGSYWITTEMGVTHLRRRRVHGLTEDDGLVMNFHHGIFQDSRGDIWFGSNGRGISILGDDGWQYFDTTKTYSNGYVNCFAEDGNGDIWYGTQGTGAFRIDVDRMIVDSSVTVDDGLSDGFIRTIHIDNEKNIWMDTSSGINRVDATNGSVFQLTEEEGLTSELVLAVEEDPAGRMWFGTVGGGIIRYQKDEIKVYSTDNILENDNITSLMLDNRGHMWAGTLGGGVYHFASDTVHTYTTNDGFFSNRITGITQDRENNFWFASTQGIFRIPKREFEAYQNNEIDKLGGALFTKADGLPANNIRSGTDNNSLTTAEGYLLFASVDGVAVIDPSQVPSSASSVPLQINEVLVNNQPHMPGDPPLKLDYRQNSLEISYAALNYYAPEKTEFRFRMKNLDEDWKHSGQRQVAYYDFVSPGEYEFNFQATNDLGQWTPESASLSIMVEPPFWQTWWFLLLTGIGAISLVTYVVRRVSFKKLKRKNRKLEIQQKIQAERERISRDLHDNVGAQITNLITGLEISEIYLKKDEPEQAHKLVQSLDKEARFAMTELRETIWLLDQKQVSISEFTNHLRKYLNRQQQVIDELDILIKNGIDDTVILNPGQSLHLLRIMQEAFNNTRKYAEADRFEISLEKNNGHIVTQIRDDGKGINMDLEKVKKEGNGLNNMHKRVQKLSGELKIRSNGDNGTSIKLYFPISPD